MHNLYENYYSPENILVNKAAYEYLVEEIKQKADFCRENDIFHIEDTIFQ